MPDPVKHQAPPILEKKQDFELYIFDTPLPKGVQILGSATQRSLTSPCDNLLTHQTAHEIYPASTLRVVETLNSTFASA